MFRTLSTGLSVFVLLAVTGSTLFGQGSQPGSGRRLVTVNVTPGMATVAAGGTVQLAAAVSGTTSTGVTWSVTPAVGTVSASGLYTAPASVTLQTLVTVTARSTFDTTKSATADVTVTPVVGVTVTPGTGTVRAGKSQQFSAKVSGAANQNVVWTVAAGVGVVSSSGIYTAPAVVTAQSTATVKATSAADASKSATVTVALLPEIAVSVTPSAAEVSAGGSATFAATVQGATNQTVVWTLSPAVGTVTSQGRYTAPASVVSRTAVTVKATSLEDGTKSATAVVTVSPAPVVSVTVTPSAATVVAGGTLQLSSGVSGTANTGVTWSASVGSVSASGLYSAPASVAASSTVTVRATSVADGTKSASATVTVNPAPIVSVSVTPSTATVAAGGTVQLAASVSGTANTGVTWSASTGSVSASGLYTAPASVSAATAVTVKATSVADATKSASATVTVNPAPVISVTVTPATATLTAGGTVQLSSTVSGAANTGVTWSATAGTVSASGLYTAPASVSAATAVTVTATSVADGSKSASATVTVNPAPVVSVTVTPTTASVTAGGTVQLSAAVTGAANTGVTWSVTPAVGTVSTSGLYTAPATVVQSATVEVIATSVADPLKFKKATLTLIPLVALSIAPAATTLKAGKTQQFQVAFGGGASQGVTWTLDPTGVGTITQGGLYTAPNSISSTQLVTVKATSVADSSKFASAMVYLSPGTPGTGDAVTSLTSFWEMDVNANDRIAWDYKGKAHGMYVGQGLQLPGTVFGSGFSRNPATQTPFNSGSMSVPGELIHTGSGSFSYGVWVRASSNVNDTILGRWGSDSPEHKSWRLNFSHGNGQATLVYAMTNGAVAVIADPVTTVTPGELVLVWVAYNSSTGELSVAANANDWVSVTPPAPFQVSPPVCIKGGEVIPPYPCTLDFGHMFNKYFPAGSPVIGRTMFWNGYIPTNAERSAIYNGKAGQDASYFGLTLDHPARPLTVSLVNSNFADDTLWADKGLYWLRPFPLKFWDPALAAARGNYVWVRSADHLQTTGFPNGQCLIGYSSSPEILPTKWFRINLRITEPNWADMETPTLEYDPGTKLFHLYGQAQKTNNSNPYIQATHVFTSPDLVTWTWKSHFPNNMSGVRTYNHTGYANVVRNGPGDWTAQSLLDSGEPGTDGVVRAGVWSSSDGVTWTFVRETRMMDVLFPYRNQQNQLVASSTNGPSQPFSLAFNSNYVSAPATQFELAYPLWPLFMHDGDGSYNGVQGKWLQDVRSYEENGTVYLYAKWGFREPSTVRLFKGTYGGLPQLSVTAAPSAVNLGPSGSQQFTAAVTGAGNTAVTWSLSPAVGTISAAGLYTAPASVSTVQTIMVKATSVADAAKFGTATVNLSPAIAVSITPASKTLLASQTQLFTASVSSGNSADIAWSVSPAVGTISANGQTAVYAAPSIINQQQIVEVEARSIVQPGSFAKALITIVPAVAITLTPGSLELSQGQSAQFMASVTGSTNTAVEWTITPAVGTISGNGLYTAPAALAADQIVTVTAKSAADTTKSATATVQLRNTPPLSFTVNANGLASLMYKGVNYNYAGETLMTNLRYQPTTGAEQSGPPSCDSTVNGNQVTKNCTFGEASFRAVASYFLCTPNTICADLTVTSQSGSGTFNDITFSTLGLLRSGRDTSTGGGVVDDGNPIVLVNFANGQWGTWIENPGSDKNAEVYCGWPTDVCKNYSGILKIGPGQTKTMRVAARFTETGMKASKYDFAPEAYARYREAWPPVINWPDRRPIMSWFIGDTEKSTAMNPRGYLQDANLDVSNQVLFRDRVLSRAREIRDAMNGRAIRPQGILIWDIEGQEFVHPTTYIGDPRVFEAGYAPEMNAVANEMFAVFRDAGYRVGVTLRPQYLQWGTQLPSACTYNAVREFSDHYIKINEPFGNRFYGCYDPQGLLWTLFPRGNGEQTIYAKEKVNEVLELLKSKTRYARDRWGATMFYIDSAVWSGGKPINAEILRSLQETFPDCLFIPEQEYLPSMSATIPYTDPIQGTQWAFSPAAWRWAFPEGAMAVRMADCVGVCWSDYRENFKTGQKIGDIALYNVPFQMAASHLQAIETMIQEARSDSSSIVIKDTLSSRTITLSGTPASIREYPLKLRVYLASSESALAGSLLYCEVGQWIGENNCSVNLTGIRTAQVRYYDFTNKLVQSGPIVAVGP